MPDRLPERVTRQLEALTPPPGLLAGVIAGAHRRRRRRAIAAGVASVLAAVAITVPVALSAQPADDSEVVTAGPLPAGAATHDPSGAPSRQGPGAFRRQAIPGMTTGQATALARLCMSWQNIATAYVDPSQATLQVVARDRIGSTALVTAPIKADAQPPPGYVSLPTHTLLMQCQLLPDGTVDTVSIQQLPGSDTSIPTAVTEDIGGGGITRAAYTKETGDFNVPWLWTTGGRVIRDVTRVVWTAPTGERVSANVLNGYFVARAIAPNGNGGHLTALTAYDSSGAVIYSFKASPTPSVPSPLQDGRGFSWP